MEQLKYLFVAEFADGSIYKQDPYDKSITGVGSSFSDIQGKNIRRFSLIGKGHIFTLDLLDGHLEADGTKLYPPMYVYPGAKFKLIYYRTVQQNMTNTFVNEKHNGVLNLIKKQSIQTSSISKYCFGWEYLFKGKNHKWEMGVN